MGMLVEDSRTESIFPGLAAAKGRCESSPGRFLAVTNILYRMPHPVANLW